MNPMPTVRQVAELAGVSRGTVSNALNHPHRVDAETLKRVLQAIDALGYVPNEMARTLKSGTSNILGLILPGLHTSIFVNMARNAQVEAHRYGLNVLVADSAAVPSRQLEHLGYFEASRARGILIVPSDDAPETIAAINRVAARGYPVIAINFVSDQLKVASVITDEERAGAMAAELALARPVRSVVWVEGEAGYQPVRRRCAGFIAEIVRRDAGAMLTKIDATGLNASHGTAIAARVAEAIGDRLPAAVVAASTPLAVGIQRQLQAMGYQVPRDIEIFACEEDTEVLIPGDHVIAVGADGRVLGKTAIDLLGEMTARPHSAATARSITVAPSIVRPADRLVPAVVT